LDLINNFWRVQTGGVSMSFSPTGGLGYEKKFLIAGKRNDAGCYSTYDGLYVYDNQTSFAGSPFSPISNRGNGRLMCDSAGQVYQLNTAVGLVRLNDGKAVVTKGAFPITSDPRLGESAMVFVGLQDYISGMDPTGRPLLDAAIDPDNCSYVYVAPVVVQPINNSSATYLAAAKLQLHPGQTPCYSIAKIYDKPPELVDTHDPAHRGIHEVEVDTDGNVYVISSCLDNASSFLWAFPADNGTAVKVALDNLTGVTDGIPDPIALFAARNAKLLYLASGQNSPTATSAKIYALSTDNLTLSLARTVQINGMGHVTGISEDATTGKIWVTGFSMSNIPEPGLAPVGTLDARLFPDSSRHAAGLFRGYHHGALYPRCPAGIPGVAAEHHLRECQRELHLDEPGSRQLHDQPQGVGTPPGKPNRFGHRQRHGELHLTPRHRRRRQLRRTGQYRGLLDPDHELRRPWVLGGRRLHR
jgi:hypothetical protein